VHHPSHRLDLRQLVPQVLLIILVISVPDPAMAQTSPFLTGATALQTKHFKLIGTTGTGKSTAIRELTGATALQTNLLAWLTPIAIILVMVLGGMAMANRMSWGWCLGAILGIALGFGAPQIVTWVRGMFGV